MDTVKNLINGATATDATKVDFELTPTDFQNGVMPALRSRGLGVGDDINLFTLAQEANKILTERKKLTRNNAFDVDEVDDLIKILMSNYIHLQRLMKH